MQDKKLLVQKQIIPGRNSNNPLFLLQKKSSSAVQEVPLEQTNIFPFREENFKSF